MNSAISAGNRKRSDDVVSLDSWNEAISSPFGSVDESQVERNFDLLSDNRKHSPSFREEHRFVSKPNTGYQKSPERKLKNEKKEPLLLNPTNLISTVLPSSSSVISSTQDLQRDYPQEYEDGYCSITLNTGEFEQPDSGFGSMFPNDIQPREYFSTQKNSKYIDKCICTKDPRHDSSPHQVNSHQESCPHSCSKQKMKSKEKINNYEHEKTRHKHGHMNKHHHTNTERFNGNAGSFISSSQPNLSMGRYRDSSPADVDQSWHSRLLERLGQTNSNGFQSFPPSTRKHWRSKELHKHLQSEEDVEQSEKVKNKLKSAWNNMVYGWTLKMKTNFRMDSPIFLLGKCYHIRPTDDYVTPGQAISRVPSFEAFKQDFSSQLWFTYRQDFPAIQGTKITSDCGWGCMIRSGQMMLARAFISHFLGRDWNVFHEQTSNEDTLRKQIIKWFGDFPSDNSPFSIHRMVEVGKPFGKNPGDWYGPSSVAQIMKEAMEKAYMTQPILADICVYVAQDCTVYKQDIIDLACSRSRSGTTLSQSLTETDKQEPSPRLPEVKKSGLEWTRGVIILVPVRLGGEELNRVYAPCIKNLLAQDQCIGIMGGKPKHSLYFIGFQDEKLIYLDPHYCQDAVDTRERKFPIQSFHCLSPRKVSICKIDPSCTIGFYCKTKEDFENFILQTESIVSPPKQKYSYPMFVFNEGKCMDMNLEELNLEEDKILKIRHVNIDDNGRVRTSTIESEEFVVL